MALDFPNSPAVGATYSSGGVTYKWDGTKWAQTSLSLVTVPPIVIPPLAASWTQRNFGGATTFIDTTQGPRLFDSSTVGSGNNLRAVTFPSPTPPYTLDVLLSSIGMPAPSSFNIFGVGWTDGTKAQVNLAAASGGGIFNYNLENFSALTTYVASIAFLNPGFGPNNAWFRQSDDGTNISVAGSVDGVYFVPFYTVDKASGYLGASGYTNVGVFNNGGALGNGGFLHVVIKSWWKH